jgi:hypothetical protein
MRETLLSVNTGEHNSPADMIGNLAGSRSLTATHNRLIRVCQIT